MKCSACGKEFEERDGIQLWDAWSCGECFIRQAVQFRKELKPEDVELMRLIARELSGLMPTELLSMIILGYARNIGSPQAPEGETLRVVGEIQRLGYISFARKSLSTLQKLSALFQEFVESQEREVKDTVKRLTEGE